MNQITGKKPNGASFLALVLEPGNIHRLKQNQPIHIDVNGLFPDGVPERLELDILYSETPVRDFAELNRLADVAVNERASQTVRPHCPECRSTVEQFGVMRNESPLAIAFCSVCGCIYGAIAAKEIA